MNWLPLIAISNSYQLLLDSLLFSSNKYENAILGYVIMPNHIHLILYFKKKNLLSSFMRDFKKYTSVKIRQKLEQVGYDLNKLRTESGGFKIWQDRFDELYIRDRKHLEEKLDYIHTNPLQEHWCLAKRPEEYSYSSAFYYLKDTTHDAIVSHYFEFC
ncbi:MAG: transposase [Cytophagaceae bacterium]|nr:transposase [Cytophagaceae bacterium]